MSAADVDDLEVPARAKTLRIVHPDAPNGAPVGWRPGPVERARKEGGGKLLQRLIWTIRDARLPFAEKLVLSQLAACIGWSDKPGRPRGTCHRSVLGLADITGLSKRAVLRALAGLQERKWIAIEKRVAQGGNHRYRITPPSGACGTPPK